MRGDLGRYTPAPNAFLFGLTETPDKADKNTFWAFGAEDRGGYMSDTPSTIRDITRRCTSPCVHVDTGTG